MENHRLGQSTSPTEIHGSLNILYFCHCRHFCEPFDGNHVYSFHIFFLRDGNFVAVPHYHWMDDGCTVNNDCGDFTYHLLFLGLVLCHSLHLDWNSFCWLEALSVMCSVRQTIIAFFYNCGLMFDSWNMANRTKKRENRRGDHFTLHIINTQRNTHTRYFAFAVSPFPLVLSASPPVVESTSREHQGNALPENLPVHPTKSICSDLWCWAVHNVSTQPGNCWTHTASCLAFWFIAVYHYFTHTHTSPPLLLKDLTMNMHATV